MVFAFRDLCLDVDVNGNIAFLQLLSDMAISKANQRALPESSKRQHRDDHFLSQVGDVDETLQLLRLRSPVLVDDSEKVITVEISNSVVKATHGASKAFMVSYWEGALGFVLEKEFSVGEGDA